MEGMARTKDEAADPGHEGARLKRYLEEKGVRQVDFATKLGKSRAAVSQWVGTPMFAPAMWSEIERGLRAMSLDPSRIRQPSMRHAQVEHAGRLAELLSAFPDRDQL